VITDNDLSGGTDGIRIEKGHGNLVADNTSERTPSGLWPSDHGGVVSRLELLKK